MATKIDDFGITTMLDSSAINPLIKARISNLSVLKCIKFNQEAIHETELATERDIRSQYYFQQFVKNTKNENFYFEYFEALVLDSISDEFLLSRVKSFLYYKKNKSSRELTSLALFLCCCNYPLSASSIYHYILDNESNNKNIQNKLNDLLNNFSEDHQFLSLYYQDNLDYLIKYGMQFYDNGEYNKAIFYLSKIINIHQNSDYIKSLGLAYIYAFKYDEVKQFACQVIVDDDRNYIGYYLYAYASFLQVDYATAIRYYNLALQMHPLNKYFSIKNIYSSVKTLLKKITYTSRTRVSISLIRQLMEYVNIKKTRAGVLISLGREKEAIREFYQISNIYRPDFYLAYENLYQLDYSLFIKAVKKLENRTIFFSKVIKFCQLLIPLRKMTKLSKYIQSLYITLGRIALLNLNLEQAEIYFKQANSKNLNSRAQEWLGYVYLWSKRYDESISCYYKALELSPNNVSIILNIARVLLEQNRIEEAKQFVYKYQQLLESPKNKNQSHLVRRNLKYALGDIEGAWQVFKDRKICDALVSNQSFTYSDNVFSLDLDNQSVLILSEWGPGDELRWASIYPELASKIPNLTIGCDPRLYQLFSRSFTDIKFIEINKRVRGNMPAEDYQYFNRVDDNILTHVLDNKGFAYAKEQDYVTLVSNILGELRKEKQLFTQHYGLLTVDHKLKNNIINWLKNLPDNRLNIGFCWKSGLIDIARKTHYIELEFWQSVLKIPSINFINLQYADYEEDIKKIKENLNIDIYSTDIDLKNDLDSVAALIKCMDLIISPTTIIAELAGMLGVPTLLVSYSPEIDWRVKIDGNDLWHASIKHIKSENNTSMLLSQQSIVAQVEDELKQLLHNGNYNDK